MLGMSYEKKITLEFFLRTMDAGTFSIANVRKKYSFITDSEFVELIKICAAKKIIKIDKNDKTMTYNKNFELIINFIEKTDFVNQMEILSKTGKIPQKIKNYLDKTKFMDRIKKKNPLENFNISEELDRCLILEYNRSFIKEITILDIKLKYKEVDKNHE